MKFSLFGFLFIMWILIIVGGGAVVVFLGPFSISGLTEFDQLITSVIKAAVALVLVVVWIVVLSKFKNWIFKKEIKY